MLHRHSEFVNRSCVHDNELLYSIEGGEFLDYLSDYKLLKNDTCSKLIVTFYFLLVQCKLCISCLMVQKREYIYMLCNVYP